MESSNWRDFGATFSVADTVIPLNPQYLHPMKGWGQVTHAYEFPLQCPPEWAAIVQAAIAKGSPKLGHPDNP